MGGKTHTAPEGERRRRVERERSLTELAERQHGVVSRHQLLAAGVSGRAIERRLELGWLHSLHRGVYALGRKQVGLRGRWMAAVLACGDGAVLSHRSAAALWGLTGPRSSPVDVTSTHGRTGRTGIRLHRSTLLDDERAVEARIPVTSVARTLRDLAEVEDEDRLRRAFEEADRLKILRMPALERTCGQAGARKGLLALRRLIEAAREPAVTRSPLENRFAEFCREHLADLPAPQTNVSILGHEVDAYWAPQRLVVEMDSWGSHSHRAAFERDRARDAAMQAAGYRVIRLTHRRLESDSTAISAQLRQLLSADGLAAPG